MLGDLAQLGAEAHVDTDTLGRVLHVGGHVLVEGGHQLAGALDERHAQAALHERLGHLEPDVAPADDDRALAPVLQRGAEALGGVDGPRRLGRVGARHVGRDGLGAGGEHDLVEALGALAPLWSRTVSSRRSRSTAVTVVRVWTAIPLARCSSGERVTSRSESSKSPPMKYGIPHAEKEV